MVDLLRVGTTYVPVKNVQESTDWYTANLSAVCNYQDDDKSIINLANQSFFLVRAKAGQSTNFEDTDGQTRFSLTFEVNGLENLEALHKNFIEKGISVGEVEDRGHAGRNFVFSDPDGNRFDVWSELSPSFKEHYGI